MVLFRGLKASGLLRNRGGQISISTIEGVWECNGNKAGKVSEDNFILNLTKGL